MQSNKTTVTSALVMLVARQVSHGVSQWSPAQCRCGIYGIKERLEIHPRPKGAVNMTAQMLDFVAVSHCYEVANTGFYTKLGYFFCQVITNIPVFSDVFLIPWSRLGCRRAGSCEGHRVETTVCHVYVKEGFRGGAYPSAGATGMEYEAKSLMKRITKGDE